MSSKYREVARRFRDQITTGSLPHGYALPSTRELADQWGTSVYTVTAAMKLLEAEGLVIVKPRTGRVVNSPGAATSTPPAEGAPRNTLVGHRLVLRLDDDEQQRILFDGVDMTEIVRSVSLVIENGRVTELQLAVSVNDVEADFASILRACGDAL